MARFFGKRLLGLLVTLLVASFVVYGSIYVSPGSPETVLFGSRPPSPQVQSAVRHNLGLDRGLLGGYGHWLHDVLSGNFGVSLISDQSVTSRLSHPLTITLALVAYAAILTIVLGIGLGLLAALKPGPVDAVVTLIMSLATALPAFVAASVAIAMFSVRLHWFPSYGLEPGFSGWITSLTLPAFCLAIIGSGLVARITRATARLQLASDHTQTAIARGISRPHIVRAHVLRNSAAPVATVSGLQIAALFAGAVVVEQAFGLGGLGQLLISSVQQKDFPVVQAVCLIIVFAFVSINFAADVLVAVLDPRARKAVPQ